MKQLWSWEQQIFGQIKIQVEVGLRWWVEINHFGNERQRRSSKDSQQNILVRLDIYGFDVCWNVYNQSIIPTNKCLKICFFQQHSLDTILYAFNLCNQIMISELGESFLQMNAGKRSIKMPLNFDQQYIRNSINKLKKKKIKSKGSFYITLSFHFQIGQFV
ncbi:unnamed protein product [Paramecium octaurelia]|uniref:Uncharacterized protein n=1 Tax=Paramecium octaurelia TaxID=43137 RepID=A0A8S1V416_PAROT|nr:unnamed protein product [Paramecium octaurelia]